MSIDVIQDLFTRIKEVVRADNGENCFARIM